MFGAAVEQQRRPGPSSMAKFVLLVVRRCKPPATFPGSSEAPTRAHTRRCAQSSATQTHACGRCNLSTEGRGGKKKKLKIKTLQPCSHSGSGSFKDKTYNTCSKVFVITCLYKSCSMFLDFFSSGCKNRRETAILSNCGPLLEEPCNKKRRIHTLTQGSATGDR